MQKVIVKSKVRVRARKKGAFPTGADREARHGAEQESGKERLPSQHNPFTTSLEERLAGNG